MLGTVSMEIVGSLVRRRASRATSATLFGVALALTAALAAAATPSRTPGSSAAASTPVPGAAAFGALPAMSHVELSPDGRTLAWAVDQGAKGAVVVAVDLASGDTRRTFPLGATGKLRGLSWADDETLLIEVSIAHELQDWRRREKDSLEFFRTIAVDLAGGAPRMLLMDDGNRSWVTGAEIVALRPRKPKTVVMSSFDFALTRANQTVDTRIAKGRRDTAWISRLFEVDLRTGKGRALESGTSFTEGWVVGRDGEPLARADWEPVLRLFRVYALRGGSWTEIHRLENGSRLTLVGPSPDGTAALAIGAAGDGRSRLWSIALDGSGARVLVEDERYDVESVLLDVDGQRPVAVWIGGAEGRLRWIDAAEERVHARIAQAFAGRQVEIRSRSRDGQRVLAYVSSPAHAPVYYLVDLAKRSAEIVGEPYPALVDLPLGEVRAITYPARDGTPIPAYLALPPGRPAQGLPLVVMPHGGPEARDEYAFDWFVQFLATRGYAVLQPQFRGSTGFGDAHRLAGYRQWGGLMQDDVTDGVKAMIEQGIADARRVCIVGASYGGYAALAGATLTPELYACAASINGVADLPTMLGHVDRAGDESDAVAYWKDHIGSVHDPKVAERSPARRAQHVRAPILLLHGTADSVVPIAQSETMARALAAHGKPHEFVKLPGEDHWLSGGETRTRVLQELEEFLAQHLAAPARTAAN